MGAPSLLLFDLGGVLVGNTTFESLNRLLPELLSAKGFRDKWSLSSAVRRFERGEIPPGAFAEAFIAEWGLRISPDLFLKAYPTWLSGLYPGALDAIRALRRRHRVACLSNCSVLHWDKLGGILDEFDVALSSHLLGAMKPDKEAFLRAFEICRVEPKEVCFFDDTPANVEAARRLGARAFHVEGIARLLDTLRAEGLLPS